MSNGVRIYGNDKITLLVSDFQLGSSADNVSRVYVLATSALILSAD